MIVAPDCAAASTTSSRNPRSLRLASSAENSTSSQCFLPCSIIEVIWSSASARTMRSLCFRCRSLVARKMCRRGFAAGSRARSAASTSSRLARASAATRLTLISPATARTDSRSPGEAIGNPASMISTPRRSNWCASCSFSSRCIEKPGDCSPSRSVVSKMCTRSIEDSSDHPSIVFPRASRPIYNPCIPDKSLLYRKLGLGGFVDLASLQVFQMVANERSYSRAAEKLFRTQPAISIAMRKLEEWVGQPLFVPGSGAKTLTDAGVLLLEYSNRMLNLREEIRKGLHELRGLERGQVSVGVNESSIHALLPALDKYREAYPGIHIRVHRVFSRDVPRELLNHQLDIGVITYLPEERELLAVKFYRDSLAFVVWPSHKLAKRREVDISALGEESFVAHIVESPYRRQVVQMFARHRVPLRMDLELPTIESIKRFVQMKRGVAIVPRMCVEAELARDDLRELRIRQMQIESHLYLVYRQDRPLSAAARGLVETILSKKKKRSSSAHREHSKAKASSRTSAKRFIGR